jgi:CheY-like chemotaxis protein
MSAGSAFDPRAMSILVVDDNPQMRTILKSILFSFGVREITLAVDGEDALAKLPHRPTAPTTPRSAIGLWRRWTAWRLLRMFARIPLRSFANCRS